MQTAYEDLESRFEVEKSSRQELEKNLMKAIEELTNTKVTSAELTEENSKISWEIQKLEREKKVIFISEGVDIFKLTFQTYIF